MHVRSIIFVALALIAAAPNAAWSKTPVGKWATKGGKSHVAIAPCGDKLCGRIVWLKNPNTDEGKPKIDKNNPNSMKQARPILGLQILHGFEKDEDEANVWRSGRIYNPEDGKTYRCTLTLRSDGTLRVRGYIGIPLLGKSQIWKRIE